jgi:hypothetical protein
MKILRGFCSKPRGLSRSSPLRSDGSWISYMGAGPHEKRPKALKTELAQGGGESDSSPLKFMVLVMARPEARPCERWPKTLRKSWKTTLESQRT